MATVRIALVPFTLPVLCLALLACAPPPPPPQEEQIVFTERCDAANFEYLKGQPLDTVTTLTTTLRTRVLAADSFVPRDFDPNRLTFTASPEGNVSRIFCG